MPDVLIASQEKALTRLRAALANTPKIVIDVFAVLFGQDITEEDFMIYNLATGEALACLNYLIERDEVDFVTDVGGVCWYRTIRV